MIYQILCGASFRFCRARLKEVCARTESEVVTLSSELDLLKKEARKRIEMAEAASQELRQTYFK